MSIALTVLITFFAGMGAGLGTGFAGMSAAAVISPMLMTFTALTGAVSHFTIGGLPDVLTWVLCVVFTLLWAQIAAVFANKAQPKTLNRATGIVLVVLGIVIMGFQLLS